MEQTSELQKAMKEMRLETKLDAHQAKTDAAYEMMAKLVPIM
jgi:hypothetical protein